MVIPHGYSTPVTTWPFHITDHMVIPDYLPHGHSTPFNTWSYQWLFYTSDHMVIPHHWPHGHSTLLTTWSFHITDHMVIPHYLPHGHFTSLTTWPFHVTHYTVPSPVSASVSVRGQLSVGHGVGWTVSVSCRWAPPGDRRPQQAPASSPSPWNPFSGICTSARLSHQSKSRWQTVIWKKWHIYVYSQQNFLMLPSVLWHCWLGSRKGIRPVKNMAGWWRWTLVSPDGVAPSWMVDVSASVNLRLHHEVQKFPSATSPPAWFRKKGRKTVVCVCVCVCVCYLYSHTTICLKPAFSHLRNLVMNIHCVTYYT